MVFVVSFFFCFREPVDTDGRENHTHNTRNIPADRKPYNQPQRAYRFGSLLFCWSIFLGMSFKKGKVIDANCSGLPLLARTSKMEQIKKSKKEK